MTQCRFQKERLRLLRAEQPGVGKERGQRGDVTAFPVRVPADRPSRPPRGVPGASLGRRGELATRAAAGAWRSAPEPAGEVTAHEGPALRRNQARNPT